MSNRDDEILNVLARMVAEQREHRSETSRSFAALDKKVDLHIQKTEYELAKINTQDEIQNQLLDLHIAGVNTLREIHQEHVKENNSRFSKLEEPRKFIKTATRVVLWAGGIGTAVVAVVELLAKLQGH